MADGIEKIVKNNWLFFAAFAIVAALVALCMAGYLRPYGYDCCGWIDTDCPNCDGNQEVITVTEECKSCAESTFPNCAGECPGSTESSPIICTPTYNIAYAGYRCACQPWYPVPR